MTFRTAIVASLILVASTLPCAAAKRSVHLFSETYVFNFPRSFAFVKRINADDGKRQTVVFQSGKRSIAVSGSIYDAANTAALIDEDSFMARMKSSGAAETKYVNEERDQGRAGSVMLGACEGSACHYKMSAAIGQKIWLTLQVSCEQCSGKDVKETGRLAETLYAQLRTF